jgi:hypothetical protein
LFQRPPIDQWRSGEVLESKTEITGDGAFLGRLTAGFAACDELRDVGINGRDILKISHFAIVVKLRNVVGTELIDLVKGSGVPVGIEVNK